MYSSCKGIRIRAPKKKKLEFQLALRTSSSPNFACMPWASLMIKVFNLWPIGQVRLLARRYNVFVRGNGTALFIEPCGCSLSCWTPCVFLSFSISHGGKFMLLPFFTWFSLALQGSKINKHSNIEHVISLKIWYPRNVSNTHFFHIFFSEELWDLTQVILAFWLVLAYDLLKDRCTIDVICIKFFPLSF